MNLNTVIWEPWDPALQPYRPLVPEHGAHRIAAETWDDGIILLVAHDNDGRPKFYAYISALPDGDWE